jgi:hypothetical protein
VAVVCKQTIPTERPPLVGKVNANLLRVEGVAWSARRISMALNLGFLDRSRYFFIQLAPQLSLVHKAMELNLEHFINFSILV